MIKPEMHISADNVIIGVYKGTKGIVRNELGDIYLCEIFPDDADDIIGTVVSSEYLENLDNLSDDEHEAILKAVLKGKGYEV